MSVRLDVRVVGSTFYLNLSLEKQFVPLLQLEFVPPHSPVFSPLSLLSPQILGSVKVTTDIFLFLNLFA